jgi:hypothetical protein
MLLLPQWAESLDKEEDIVTKYRKWRPLYDRVYCDDVIRSSVFAINMCIRNAVFQGRDDLAYGLARMLEQAEPLEKRIIDDPQGQRLKHMADLILVGSRP